MNLAQRITELEKENRQLRSELDKYRKEGSAKGDDRSAGDEIRFSLVSAQMLTENELKFRTVFDESPAFITLSRFEDGTFAEVNKTYCRISGYTPEELIGRTSLELGLITAEERSKITTALNKGSFDRMGVQLRAKNGEIKYVAFSAEKIDVLGETYMLASGIDVTENKKSEEKLRESESMFRQMADAMPHLIFVARPDGFHEYFNNRWYEFTGVPPGETGGDFWSQLLHPDDYGRTLETWRHSLATGEPYSIEYRFKKGEDSSYHWFLGRAMPARNESGEIIRWIGTLTYMQEQKETEQKLRETEERYQMVNRATFDIVWDWNIITGQIEWNEVVEEATGRRRSEIPSSVRSWEEHIHPGDRERVVASINKAIDSGAESWQSEYRFGKIDGPWRTYLDRGFIARDQNGRAYRMIGSMLDLTERMRAEEKVRKSENLLQKVLEVLPVGVFVADEEGRIAQTNPACEKIWGGTRHVPIDQFNEYRGWWKDTGKRIQAEEWAFARAFLKGETSLDEEIEIECFDGTRKIILNSAVPVRDERGEIISAVATITDITRRVEVERALAAERELLQAIIDGIPVMITVYPPDMSNFRMNRAFRELTGLTGSEDNVMELVFPEPGERDRAANFMRFLEPGFRDFLMWTSDGRKIETIWANVRLHDDTRVGIGVDISERKAMEKKLREQAMMLEQVQDAIVAIDTAGNLKYMNDTAYRMYEIHRHAGIQELSFLNFMQWDNITSEEDLFRKLKTEPQWHGESIHVTAGGNNLWVDSVVSAIKGPEGEITGALASMRNITDRKKLQEELQRRMDEQKKTGELLENLLYIAAHDLKGPIANMYLALNLIDRIGDPGKKIQTLGIFRPLVNRLENTIKGLADILQMQSINESAVRPVWFENIMNEIMLENRERLYEGNIRYDFNKAPCIRYIEPFLVSILKNLVNNAIKYSRDDVQLGIEVSAEPIAYGKVLLTVKDNGIGIDLEKHGKQMFKPFNRFSPEKGEGTGVGLYMIKNMIEKNGGLIKVQSTPGKGSTFHCYLQEYVGRG